MRACVRARARACACVRACVRVCVCVCVCCCCCRCYDSWEEEKTFCTSGLVYIQRIHHVTMTTSVISVSPTYSVRLLCMSPSVQRNNQLRTVLKALTRSVMYVSLQHALSVTLTFPIFAKGQSADCGHKGLDKICCYFCLLQIIINFSWCYFCLCPLPPH